MCEEDCKRKKEGQCLCKEREILSLTQYEDSLTREKKEAEERAAEERRFEERVGVIWDPKDMRRGRKTH